MEYLILKVCTQSSTFRNPEFQNYHKSFTLPPPTTIIGFAGAALGLSPKESQDFFFQESIQFNFGVYGNNSGIANDLWKYNDFKAGSVINREILFLNSYYLVYASESKQKILDLHTGFSNPIYALTLGNSDNLAKVKIINSNNIEEGESDNLTNCLISGNVLKETISNISNGLEFSIYSTDSVCFDLPVSFEYSSSYGVRKVIARKPFSFINKLMKLNIKKKGVFCDGKFIPLFNLN